MFFDEATLDLPAVSLVRDLLGRRFGLSLALVALHGSSRGSCAPREAKEGTACDLWMRDPVGRASCAGMAQALIRLLEERGSAEAAADLVMLSNCHAGLTVAAAPITNGGALVGAAITSGFTGPGVVGSRERVERGFVRFGASLDAARAHIAQAPRLSSDSLPHLEDLLLLLVERVEEHLDAVPPYRLHGGRAMPFDAELIGSSARMRAVRRRLKELSAADCPVLIIGEGGTGKRLLARLLHRDGERSGGPFVTYGPDSNERPPIEQAAAGTLFIENLERLGAAAQTELLNLLDERVSGRSNGTPSRVGARPRIIAATIREPEHSIEEGTLGADLAHRLALAEVRLPALRERPEDLPELMESIASTFFAGSSLLERLSPRALERLLAYPWPGNVRELEGEVERLSMLGRASVIGETALSPRVRAGASPLAADGREGSLRLDEVERGVIVDALTLHDGNRTHAAKALGISRRHLIRRIAAMGL